MNVRLYEVLFLVCGLAYAELMLQLEPLCGPHVSLTSLIACVALTDVCPCPCS